MVKKWKNNKNMTGNPGGPVYGLGMIGAVVYYIQNADTFWIGVLGVLKAILWPAFLVHGLLGFINL